MDNAIELRVLTPEKELFFGKVSGVKVPGNKGAFEILKNHAPIISVLDKGKLRINAEGKKMIKIIISGGFVECLENKVNILIESGTVEED